MMKRSLEDITIDNLLRQFLKSLDDKNLNAGVKREKEQLATINQNVLINHIAKSDKFGVRMVLCEMGNLPISSAYTSIDYLCRLKLLELIVPFLLHFDLEEMRIQDLDVIDVVKTTINDNKDTVFIEPIAAKFYQELKALQDTYLETLNSKKPNKTTKTQQQEKYADDIEILINDYLESNFFINTDTDKNGSNRLVFEIDVKINNIKTSRQDVKITKLFPSDLILANIIEYIASLELSYGISKIFIIENTNYDDHVLHLSYHSY